MASDLQSQSRRQLTLYILSLGAILLLFFGCTNVFVFYTIFELSLVPIFILVLGWGYQPERLKAGLSLLFYTLVGSLPLIALLFGAWSLNITFLTKTDNLIPRLELWAIMSLSAFLIKTPIFLVHLWLPKAHVEAPVYGSILLAALLLKLGTYGFLVFSPVLYLAKRRSWLARISIWGCFVVGLLCSRVLDVKIIIAFSSVAHIAIVIFLVCFNNWIRISRSIIIIVAHGFSSAGLFLMAHLQYVRSHRRALMLNKLALGMTPALGLLWFLIIAINLAAPPTFNLLAELTIVVRLVAQLKYLGVLIIGIILTSSVYSLVLYSSITQMASSKSRIVSVICSRELLNRVIYIIPGWLIILATPVLI